MDPEMMCMGCMKEKEKEVNVCTFCGYDEAEEISPLILSPRTQLMKDHYLVGRILGKPGGFGITYLGWDIKLETKVAVKEFLPRDLVGRDIDHTTVVPHHSDDRELFKYGLERFLQEAQTLAKFSHPNVVRVRTFFEENKTAYLVMDYYEGISLARYMKDQGGRLDEKLAIEIIMPILDGLREVHEKGFLHRDIKPQNIYLTEDGIPILLDFGSARFAVGERSQSLSVVLSPGYSPYEQYHKKGKQGAWTDIYSAAATLYHMLSGQPPVDAADRIMEDDLEPLKQLTPEVSPQINDALMQALSIKAKDRPQTAAEFQEMIIKDREHLFKIPSKRSEIDDAVFQFAIKVGTQKAIKLYLEQFPGGIHAAEAEEILKPISKKSGKKQKQQKKEKKTKKANEEPEELKKELEYTGEQKQVIINLEEELEKAEEQMDARENQEEEEELIIEYRPLNVRI